MTRLDYVATLFNLCMDRRVANGTTDLLHVTEGRQSSASLKYGWCGDAVTWALLCMGCRDGTLLNRAFLNGAWRVGQNGTMLFDWARRHAVVRSGMPDVAAIAAIRASQGEHYCFVDAVEGSSFLTWDGNTYGGGFGYNRRDASVMIAWFALDAVPLTRAALDASLSLSIKIPPTARNAVTNGATSLTSSQHIIIANDLGEGVY